MGLCQTKRMAVERSNPTESSWWRCLVQFTIDHALISLKTAIMSDVYRPNDISLEVRTSLRSDPSVQNMPCHLHLDRDVDKLNGMLIITYTSPFHTDHPVAKQANPGYDGCSFRSLNPRFALVLSQSLGPWERN